MQAQPESWALRGVRLLQAHVRRWACLGLAPDHILVAHDAVSGAAGGIRISCRAFMVPAGDPGAMSNEWFEPVDAQAYESLA